MRKFRKYLAIVTLSVISWLPVWGYSADKPRLDASEYKKILILGDSLSAAYKLAAEEGWVHLLQERLDRDGLPFSVVNASVSGATTAAGLQILPNALSAHKPAFVLIELGANDGLQGHPLEKIEKNLNSMLDIIQNNGIQAVVFGISIPASYGPRYIDKFRDIFPNVAQQRGLPFFDLYQENFFLQPGYMQKDGLHPTAIGQPIIRDLIADFLEQQKLLENTKE